MTDITQFNVQGNRVTFSIDDEDFTVKYPDQYVWGRKHRDLMKDIAYCAWANKMAFDDSMEADICFGVDPTQAAFWLWIAERVHLLDIYQSKEREDEVKERRDYRSIRLTGGGDPSTLVEPTVEEQEYDGALVCQSPGKESIASKLILEENGIDPVYSMFYEYPSRAATHKITGREEFEQYYDNPTIRVWSDTNTLQSTLQEMTEMYEPITCFWEMMYAVISVPLMVEHGLEYLLMGNQLNTGEAFPDEERDFVAFEEINQSYIFEVAYSDMLDEVHDLPITHTSNVRPLTGYACRKVIGEHDPGWLPHMQNCIKPKPASQWCLTCYKCCNSWVEFMACGINPEEAGLSHDVLVENQFLGGDGEPWNFSFPRFERDEHVWRMEGAGAFFYENVVGDLNDEQYDGFMTWRNRQEERVDPEDVEYMDQFNGKYIEPATVTIPDETLNDMGLEHTDYIPDELDPSIWNGWSSEWHMFKSVEKVDDS